MTERPKRNLTIEQDSWVLVEAWRSSTGLGLGYFLGPVVAADRRAVLDREVDVAALDDAEVLALWEAAAPLTVTERRFADHGGESWLAQASGPVWGEGAAAGTLGVRFTCITADRPGLELPGRRLTDLDDEELAGAVAEA
jgi:hypothetical protein